MFIFSKKKKSAYSITFALTYILNLSLKEVVFIDKWKSTSITTVFKNDGKDHGYKLQAYM